MVNLVEIERPDEDAVNISPGLTELPELARRRLMAKSSLPPQSASTRKSNRRKSTGKRLRFEVFKRDYFTCQYCGVQPPDVVLVVDHVVPVAAGGATTLDNLITACETCNQGKADRPLTERVIRPDADLLFLETQQEIAEHTRYLMAARELEAITEEIVQDLQQLWADVTGFDWTPSESVMRRLLIAGEPWQVQEAVQDVAVKVAGGYLSASSKAWVPYLFGCVRNLAREGDAA